MRGLSAVEWADAEAFRWLPRIFGGRGDFSGVFRHGMYSLVIPSIVRFWGIIIGRVGQFFWPCLGIVGLCEGSGVRGQGSEIRGQVSGVETGSMLLK